MSGSIITARSQRCWAALVVVPLAIAFGMPSATEAVLHTLLTEYMSFIILLFALFTISGGILVAGNIHGTPLVNAGLLLVGAILASVIGTTGASMILIRPIMRANDNRPFNAHVVIFFIFLVSNIGGSLTPLGDPPLFVGFLRGVDFFWTTANLWRETLFVGGVVLAVFLAIDIILHRREGGAPKIKDPTPDTKVRIRGLANLPLLAGVIGAILLSATWKPGVSFSILGVSLELQNLVRDAIILALALLSLAVSHKSHREANGFNWGPIAEVAKLFAGIFICIVPVIAILRAGHDGALAPLVALVTSPAGAAQRPRLFLADRGAVVLPRQCADLSGVLRARRRRSAASDDGVASTLAAISAGAVFMGANTYIGNAPNFMVYAIARHRGVKMPGFFGYMLWSGLVLIPTF